MKRTLLKMFTGLILFSWATLVSNGVPAVIPWPQQMEPGTGACQLTAHTEIYASWGSLATARQLAANLRAATGYPFEVHLKLWGSEAIPQAIFLTTKKADAALGTEGYELMVNSNSVVIRAPAQTGLYYGGETMRQLLPPEIFSTNPAPNITWQIPCVLVRDWPRFSWRGFMLDVSRHFYNVDEVEKILDLMALYKLNMFHMHLVDSQGWRIEIKKYPQLTKVGAWRTRGEITSSSGNGVINAHPAWATATPDKYAADGRYGGFYTQDDIRTLVTYAAARHITIVPEIEMPGHSGAALAAYPQFGGRHAANSTDTPISGHNPPAFGIYNPANPDTFKFLDDVLAEVFTLFPGKYVHIGGDEVQKRYWMNDPDCQALMRREGLNSAAELQSWFIKRIEKFVDAHGKTLVGWSEIRQGGLAKNAVVMDWIGGATEAAAAGHDVVMTPNSYCYLNYYQSTNREDEPRAQGGFLPLAKIYSFEPVPADLPAQFQGHILGAQGNLWTEWVASLPHVEYMLFPRLCALAEVDWSAKGARDWNSFQSRLAVDEQRLNKLEVNYRQEPAGQSAPSQGDFKR